jgi:hypothetical protein
MTTSSDPNTVMPASPERELVLGGELRTRILTTVDETGGGSVSPTTPAARGADASSSAHAVRGALLRARGLTDGADPTELGDVVIGPPGTTPA